MATSAKKKSRKVAAKKEVRVAAVSQQERRSLFAMPKMPENTAPYSLQSLARVVSNNAGLIFLGLSIFIVGFLVGSVWTENRMLKAGVGTAAAAAQPAAGQQ